MSSKYAHKVHVAGAAAAANAVGTGAVNNSEEKKSDADEEKKRTSVQMVVLRPEPSSPPLSAAEMAAETEGEAGVEYDELPAAVRLERAVERLAKTVSSDSEETRVVTA